MGSLTDYVVCAGCGKQLTQGETICDGCQSIELVSQGLEQEEGDK